MAVDSTIMFLTYLTVVLLIGIITAIISNKLKLPNILLLIISGLILGTLRYGDGQLISFPNIFLSGIGTLALAMIVFDSCSRLKWREFDTFTLLALKETGIFLLFNFVFLTIATMYIFGIENIYIALIFSALMTGTSPDAVVAVFKGESNRSIEFLKIESILNTPLVVLLPFLILELYNSMTDVSFVTTFVTQLKPFITQFVAGIGAGVLMGLIIFKFMKKYYSEELSPLALVTVTLLTYILAENLGGNGVLAVTVTGLFFGNVYVKEKKELHEFSETFSTSLIILVFVLIGLSIHLPATSAFFFNSLILFLIYVLIRFASILVTFRSLDYTLKEKIFLTLNMPKGIAVAVTVFSLGTIVTGIADITTVFNLTIVFMLYTLIVTTLVTKYAYFFFPKLSKKVNKK